MKKVVMMMVVLVSMASMPAAFAQSACESAAEDAALGKAYNGDNEDASIDCKVHAKEVADNEYIVDVNCPTVKASYEVKTKTSKIHGKYEQCSAVSVGELMKNL